MRIRLTEHKLPLLASAGLLALFALGVLAAMLTWPQPASAQTPRLIVSPTELHVGEGKEVTYTVHFDSNPVAYDNVECGTDGEGLVYVNMRGFDFDELDVNPNIPAFKTGTDCEGGNWDNPRTIYVEPVDDSEDLGQRTFTIKHAVWDNVGGTPLEDTETPMVRVTVYDDDTMEPAVSISAGAGGTEFSNVTFTLTRKNETTDVSSQPLTVNVSLSETGAMLSRPLPSSVTFPADMDTVTLTVELDDDDVDELNSTIRAEIRAPSGYEIAGRPWARVEGFDNDTALLGLSVDPASISEDERGRSTSEVTVSVTNDVTFAEKREFTLDFTGSVAVEDTDFRVNRETLTLQSGQTAVTATITALHDTDYELEETIRVLAREGNRTIGPATITIEASDSDAPQPTWNATLTVVQGTANGDTFLGYSGGTGALAPNTFTVGTTTYTVNKLTLDDPSGSNPTLIFGTTSILTTDFVLELGGREFRPMDATGTLSAYEWTSPNLGWSDGQAVAVKLDVFDPMLSRVRMDNVITDTADAVVETVNANGSAVYLRYRSQGSTSWSNPNPAMITVMPGMTSVTFGLTGLNESTVYEVQASLESTFAEFEDAPASEKATFTAGTPPTPPPPPPGPPGPPTGTTGQEGTVTLSSEEPQVGTELTADLTDADEGIADLTWLWERSTDQNAWTAISGAESASYTPVEADVDHYLRVTATYTDSLGEDNTAQAETAAPVAAAETPEPPAPTDPCVTALGTLAGTVAETGSWASDCESTSRSGSYAHFYTFTLDEDAEVTIDLTSSEDTYLFLLHGTGKDGTEVANNDDIVTGTTNSQIITTLDAGAYTVEATTYSSGATGDFNLSVTGPAVTTTPPPVMPPSGPARPQPTDDDCVLTFETLMAMGEVEGEWTGDCNSTNRSGSYARFYTFTLEEETEVTIELTSEVDTYLFLLDGADKTTEFRTENDDIETGVNSNSRIVETLEAGTYTVEATTYGAGETGDFALAISVPQEGGTEPPATDSCVQDMGTLTGGLTQTGSWADDCESTNREGRYARYYSFTLAEETDVTVELTSTQDPYLFLLQGAGRDGAVDEENDDIVAAVDTNSRIAKTLAAGTYTIEATTYSVGSTGEFTLSITGPGGTTPTDSCVQDLGALSGTVTETGSWASDCESTNREGRYARFYTFTLEAETEVTINLTSTQDPYLYLLQGHGGDGALEAENDDIEANVNFNSRLVETLAAGDYTIEATTYAEEATAAFTLQVSR